MGYHNRFFNRKMNSKFLNVSLLGMQSLDDNSRISGNIMLLLDQWLSNSLISVELIQMNLTFLCASVKLNVFLVQN
jgi:hypothetical protein